MNEMEFPLKIICLTEESVETLYLLGREELIQGVSRYVERPPHALGKHPVVTQFIRSDIEQIVSLAPDLVIGFSDIQKNIARELIERGLNVLITNQRSLKEIMQQILLLGKLIGETDQAQILVEQFKNKLAGFQSRTAQLPKIRVYFEEWDHPRLSGIGWVSELIAAVGGENVFAHKTGGLAKEREVSDEEIIEANPDLIIGCWCGKKVDLDSFAKRPGYEKIKAIREQRVVEVSPAIFLQPGPALFVDGLDQMFNLLQSIRSGP
jgi:iron complex transport system substrate-binding protein